MTLVEVLVAFVILAMVASVIMRINATTVRNHEISRGYLEALQVARAQLSRVAPDGVRSRFVESGDAPGGVRWTLARAPFEDWREARLEGLALVPVEDRVTVAWGEGRAERMLSLARVGLVGRAQP
jgi:hypothetical protein